MDYTAIIRQTDDGWYAARCAQIPEAVTQGRTLDEVKENLLDAIELTLQMRKQQSLDELRLQPEYEFIISNVAV
jgi:predicted RNase H-like HicB family nuclease